MTEGTEALTVDLGNQLSTEPAAQEGPVGVKGWLLVLCVWLVFVIPLANLVIIVFDVLGSLGSTEHVRGLVALSLANAAMVLLLIGLSIFTGVSLWRRRDPGVIKLARIFFACFLGSRLVAALLPFLVGMETDVAQEIASSIAGSMSGAVVFSSGVYLYLLRSKRVRATYGLPESESA